MTNPDRFDGPERPIQAASEDRLERAGFVTKITNALIAPDTGKSRGVVLGVTGPWGSGKSSVLNLIAGDIKARYPDAIVVRFDPWLVSGHHDLIAAFLSEMIEAIKAQPKFEKDAQKTLQTLADYSDAVAPVINVFAPGLGSMLKGGAQWGAKKLKKDGSPVALRKRLANELADLGRPIVALIDELDRVEDAEVRAVAQLVRSVADFEGISYVLAYDPKRVAEALGDGKDEKRGRAYLEKIVQLPINLPIALPQELRGLMDAEIAAVWKALGVSDIVTINDRYRGVASVIVPKLVQTPRDLRRLVGVFHPLASMVQGEVDLIDVLGYAALLVKAPQTVEAIRSVPERCVIDPLTYAERTRRRAVQVHQDNLENIVHPDEGAANPLFLRLFPGTAGNVPMDDLHADAIGRRRGLMTMLRLGILPGEVSRGEAAELLASPAHAVREALDAALASDAIGPLIDRLAETYPDQVVEDDSGFWEGAASLLNATAEPGGERFEQLMSVGGALSDMLLGVSARAPELRWKASNIAIELSRTGDLALTPEWLFRHFFVYGLFGARADGGRAWFFDAETTNNVATNLGGQWRDQMTSGALLPRLVNAYPLLVMVRTDAWNDLCRKALQDELPNHIVRLASILFPPGGSTEGPFIEKMCGYEAFLAAAKTALSKRDLPDGATNALLRASSR